MDLSLTLLLPRAYMLVLITSSPVNVFFQIIMVNSQIHHSLPNLCHCALGIMGVLQDFDRQANMHAHTQYHESVYMYTHTHTQMRVRSKALRFLFASFNFAHLPPFIATTNSVSFLSIHHLVSFSYRVLFAFFLSTFFLIFNHISLYLMLFLFFFFS